MEMVACILFIVYMLYEMMALLPDDIKRGRRISKRKCDSPNKLI